MTPLSPSPQAKRKNQKSTVKKDLWREFYRIDEKSEEHDVETRHEYARI